MEEREGREGRERKEWREGNGREGKGSKGREGKDSPQCSMGTAQAVPFSKKAIISTFKEEDLESIFNRLRISEVTAMTV